MTIYNPTATPSCGYEHSSCRQLASMITLVPGFRHLLRQAANTVQDLRNALFGSYRPEHHYMRGPGPRWRAKHSQTSRGLAAAGGLIA